MFKFVLGAAFGILALIFIFQNVEPVDVTFLAWTLTMSRALVMLAMLIVGFLMGAAAGSASRRKRLKR